MKNNPPSKETLEMFSVTGQPVKIDSGLGSSYRVNGALLKSEDYNVEQVKWIAKIYETIKQDSFRVPKQLKTKNGKLIYNEWTAWEYFDGYHSENKWEEILKACDAFHKSLQKINKPSFFDKRKDKWAIADKMVFEEISLKYVKGSKTIMEKLLSIMRPIKVPDQIIHGDFGSGNVLFANDKKPPYVIDFSPYYRPVGFAKAIVVVDAIAWSNADIKIIEYLKNELDIDQLLIRATMRRILEAGSDGTANDFEPVVGYLIEKQKSK